MGTLNEMINTAMIICDKNNPKFEINHVLIDSENIVSTDTRMLLVIPHGIDITEDILAINDKAKYKFNDNTYEYGRICNVVTAKTYPNYKRIIIKEGYIQLEKRVWLIEALYYIQQNNNVAIDYIEFATKLKKLDKLLGEVVEYNFRENNLPISLKFKNGAQFIITPYVQGLKDEH